MAKLNFKGENMSYYSEAREYHERGKYEEAYKLYEQGANAGDEKCFYGIALFFHEGYFVEENKEKAAEIFAEHFDAILKLAENGDAEAMFIIACYYSNGFYVETNNEIAFDWLKKSAEAGYASAQWRLGYKYQEGIDVEENPVMAVEWFQKSAVQGDSEAQWRLGVLYEFGKGTNKDMAQAVKWYQKSSEQGNPEGQWRLASMYQFGDGICVDLNKAIELYKAAGDQGNLDVKEHLERIYEFGENVATKFPFEKIILQYEKQGNYEGATQFIDGQVKLLEEEIQNHETAMLGLKYEKGEGVSKDIARAIELYEQAISNGSSLAAFLLASLYLEGTGVEQNIEKYYELLELACSKEDHFYYVAANTLALDYYLGDFVKGQDLKKAFEYWSSIPESAEDGEHHFWLGQCYHNCRGVDYDITDESTKVERLTKAKEHYKKALEYDFNCRLAYEMVKRDLGERSKGGDTRSYVEELLNTTIDKSKLLEKVEGNLKNDFGEYWDKLKDNTKQALISGIFYYVMNVSCGDEICNKVDFTNVVATLSKALEIELAEFFGKGYIEFLRDVKKLPAYKFDPEYNKFVLYPDRPYKRTFIKDENAYIIKREAKVEYCDERNNYGFSLGSLYYLLNVRTMPVSDFSNVDSKMHRTVIDTKKGKSIRVIDPYMQEYARLLFRKDAFGEGDFDEMATNYLIDLAEDVRFIKDIRNPADHEIIVNRKNAEVLCDALVKTPDYKILCELLDKISPEYIQKSLEAPIKVMDNKSL